jgi:hypothetical protein
MPLLGPRSTRRSCSSSSGGPRQSTAYVWCALVVRSRSSRSTDDGTASAGFFRRGRWSRWDETESAGISRRTTQAPRAPSPRRRTRPLPIGGSRGTQLMVAALPLPTCGARSSSRSRRSPSTSAAVAMTPRRSCAGSLRACLRPLRRRRPSRRRRACWPIPRHSRSSTSSVSAATDPSRRANAIPCGRCLYR